MADVVAGLLLRDGKALLGLRKPGGKRGGLWECPGGKVDPGESHRIALIREWREEVGLTIGVGERIASAMLDLEVCFTVTLYEVIADLSATPQLLDHASLEWSDLSLAIEYSPCSPAMYLHWPCVRQWLRRRTD
jgi:8-oxo-dGTP diphosphatase